MPFAATDRRARRRLVDKILNLTGAVTRPASVDDGTSVCDFDEEEKHHKHSIEAALVHFEHGGKHFNVIDTPGYPDFIGQAIGALRAVETAAHRQSTPTPASKSTPAACFKKRAKPDWAG